MQISNLKQQLADKDGELQKLKVNHDQLVNFIASNPNVERIKGTYDYICETGDGHELLETDKDYLALTTVRQHLRKRAA